jgi:hypothetical protein
MIDTQELIARLEAATGPDRELDAAIWQACQHADWKWQHERYEAPAYTASIDAALTLCGGESGLGSLIAGNFPDGSRGWVARVRSPETADGEGRTPALAICIAALRARRGV